MMDDLSTPVESALIFFDRIEQALLGGAARALTVVLGVVLLSVALWLTLLIAGPISMRIEATGAWVSLHTIAVAGAALLGVALVSRQAWAVLALYPAFALLQLLPVLAMRGALTGGDITGAHLLAALMLEGLGLVALAVAIAWPAKSDHQDAALTEASGSLERTDGQ
jgi:hypothetical protein